MSMKNYGKHDARRSSAHEKWYDAHFPVLAKRKDRNVRQSSRGKFASVAELVAHQQGIEAKRPKRPAFRRPKPPVINWLATDGKRDSFIDNYVEK